MFGYIIVNRDELKFKEYDVYHSYYCGLCKSLQERYGFLGQASLSFDMTFMLLLLTGLYEPETILGAHRCIAHPFKKHPARRNIYTDYIADMNVLFTLYKCQDDWADEKKVYKLLYGKFLSKKRRKQRAVYEEKVKKLRHLMYEFNAAEAAAAAKEDPEEIDIDEIAGLFGRVLGEMLSPKEDEWSESLRRMGFFLGKFIYLLDAYEDVEQDIKKGTFNPFKGKFKEPVFEDDCRAFLMMMMSECCREFETLPILENVEILRNILYSGVWCRYEAVHAARMKKLEKTAK